MAKGRHAKDKLWLTPQERVETGTGFQGKTEAGRMHFIAFNSCSLGMQEAKTPVITKDGYLFDFDNINEFIKKYQKNPVTGDALRMKDLRPVKFHRNKDGEIFCPVTEKVFNHHSHIVINLKSGNVYSNEAIDQVCRSLNLWEDPITCEKFDKDSDLIDLQNPNLPPRKIDSKIFFDNKDILKSAEQNAADGSPKRSENATVELDAQSRRVKEMIDEQKEDGLLAQHKKLGLSRRADASRKAGQVMSGLYSTGALAQSFTSTAAEVTYQNTMRILTDEEVRREMYKEVRAKKAKGYARLRTTLGNLSLQLHCDLAPHACHSFLLHANNGYFTNHKFHRILPRFVFQTGDPTGTGTGGESAFHDGEPFKDEFDPNLNHVGSGIVGIANSGPGTNGSQFYITFASCPHLDKKHTIFAQVVGGKDVISKFESVKQKSGKPIDPPILLDVEVFKNPFEETEMAKKIEKDMKNKEDSAVEDSQNQDKQKNRIEDEFKEANDFVFGKGTRRNLATTVNEITKKQKK